MSEPMICENCGHSAAYHYFPRDPIPRACAHEKEYKRGGSGEPEEDVMGQCDCAEFVVASEMK